MPDQRLTRSDIIDQVASAYAEFAASHEGQQIAPLDSEFVIATTRDTRSLGKWRPARNVDWQRLARDANRRLPYWTRLQKRHG